MTAEYVEFPKKACPNVSSPCWIPQADNIIQEDILHSLPQCDTLDKYNCMLQTLRESKVTREDQVSDKGIKCMRSCKAETYRIDSYRHNINPYIRVNIYKC